MKTPQQWLDEMKARPCVTEKDLLALIQQIQEDAKTVRKGHDMSWLDEALNSGDGTYKP